MPTKTVRSERRERAEAVLAQSHHAEQRMRLTIWGVVLGALAGIVAAMLLTSQPQSSSQVRSAPDFSALHR